MGEVDVSMRKVKTCQLGRSWLVNGESNDLSMGKVKTCQWGK